MDRLKVIDKELANISRKLSFFAVNPTNVEEEQEKFFSVPGYIPQFTYEPYRENLDSLMAELKKIKTDKSIMGKIFCRVKENYSANISMLKYRGNPLFTHYSIKLHGRPEPYLIKEANKYVKLKQIEENKNLTTKQIILKLRAAFVKYGFKWTVEEKDMVSAAAVKPAKRILLIRKNEKFSERFMKRIIVHEIGTHAMRAENGRYQPYSLFLRGFPGYLKTEEGLAVLNEELNNCLDPGTLKIYAGRVLAINKALKSSFRETFDYLKKYFDEDLAYRLAVRAKRGLADTSKPGAFTKDIAYLQGYIDLKRYLKKGGSLNKLYYGRIGIQHVGLIDRIPGLVNPSYLPMVRYLRYLVDHFSSLFRTLIFLEFLRPIYHTFYDEKKKN